PPAAAPRPGTAPAAARGLAAAPPSAARRRVRCACGRALPARSALHTGLSWARSCRNLLKTDRRFCRRLGQRLEATGPEGDGQLPGPAVVVHLLHQTPQRLPLVFPRQRLPPAVKAPRAVDHGLAIARSAAR